MSQADNDAGVDLDASQEQPEVQPRSRAPGGVWLQTSDFDHAFTDLIVFHNLNKFEHTETYSDCWSDPKVPFIKKKQGIYLKLTTNE